MDIAATEKNNTPLLSIITINYNNAAGLKKTIESVVAQNFDDYEHIIVDGGSKDGSVDVIKEFLANETYARHVSWWCSEKDNGIYNAMNKGIRHASGKYCLFLNSGDWLCDDSVLKLFFNVSNNGNGTEIFYGNSYLCKNELIVGTQKSPEKIYLSFLFLNTINHQSAFISTSLLQKYYYDEKLKITSDWKFFLQALLENHTFIYFNSFISCYDYSGISSTQKKEAVNEREKVLKEILPVYVYENEHEKSLNPINKWDYYGKCLYQRKGIYNFCLFCTKAFFKLLRMLHIMKRIDI